MDGLRVAVRAYMLDTGHLNIDRRWTFAAQKYRLLTHLIPSDPIADAQIIAYFLPNCTVCTFTG
jgi:hypothetical protein